MICFDLNSSRALVRSGAASGGVIWDRWLRSAGCRKYRKLRCDDLNRSGGNRRVGSDTLSSKECEVGMRGCVWLRVRLRLTWRVHIGLRE